MTDLNASIAAAIEPLFTPEQSLVDRLSNYVAVLLKWNKRTNLTGFRTPADIILHGLVDSLVPLSILPTAGPCLDIGSGAGFPGLILAAAQPDRPWTLLEPRRKRASFLREVSRVMGLTHVEVVQQRLEQTDLVVPTITSRAVGGISAEVVQHLVTGGAWVLAASLDDARTLEGQGGYPGLRMDSRKDSPAGGPWLRLTKA